MANTMRSWIEDHSGRVYKNFINGEWVESKGGQTFPLYESAFPEKVLGYFPSSNKNDVEHAIQAAHDAFHLWKKTTASRRAKILNDFANLLERNEEELAYILSSEQGKVLSESRGEVKRAAAEARFNAGEAYRVTGMTIPSEIPGITCRVISPPLGVIAAISPWNFPIVTPVRKIAPAIAYGCTVVLKPSSDTPWSAVRLIELLQEAGLPQGVVNLINGSGNKVGDSLVTHPLVKGISFTGSTKLGIQINSEAAARLIKTQLEMGGKNAAVVANYHDLEAAAKQIVSAAFTCSGQRCTAISRVVVLEEQANGLIDHLKANMEAIQVGPAWEEKASMGPVINQHQHENILEYIELGKREGAEIILGGTVAKIENNKEGFYISPTLFINVHKDMRIARDEIFGPVLVVIKAKSIEEAIEIVNSSEYGLAVSVFTDSLSISNEFSERAEAGMVHVNHGTASQSHIPFGGVKNSGFGAFSIGHSNQDFYTSSKAIYVKA
ncbi:aldehyde dehydrogenase family protein [Bacillus sp. FJAT-49711]|uniref:aldehyde dehydrogenase family protein n=1 Tax=Bacillus sp. FJAT-49711 TaxID=2833585 RepID=UPI001BC973EC|nr:aldehyde dehydrogenase family protein [Bacillus sp. FJAT-49711]MBS4219510.1 aldehyde dehydrogenase family protein [Bacillus sp. FJAT-49711]